jgi:ADP-heptose:LPS heptosyltransferase
LGEHERTEEELEGLRDRLMPERFDMAIDLRTHPETRPLLRYTGARWLAGFDFRNRFPWLDVALDWGGDQIYARKHHHDGDDLIHLVDALAAACEAAPPTIAAPLADAGAAPAIPGSGPLVCVHPCAGNAIKQWPVAYFGALIDRLIEADNARVVLVGVAGEEAVAEDILALVRRKEAVASVVGRLPLSGLPGLLGHCALFVGNDSGPKHLAAALGVPTVGIHGGAVDVREWGPVGPAAIAVSREVTCAPCYLAYAEECPRGLACLTGLEPARVYDACRRLLPLGRKEPGKPRASAKRVSARRAD